jgi:hypothetical protein
MDTYINCGQYDVYAGKTEIRCRGFVHRVFIKWLRIGGRDAYATEPIDGGTFCEAHEEPFNLLGNRPEYKFDIAKLELVGIIGPNKPEGNSGNKEKELF